MKNTPRRLFTAVLALTTALIFFLPTGSFTATANDRQAEKSIIVIGDVSSMFSGWEEIFENDSGETLLVLSSPDMNSESAKETARERIGIGSTVFIALGTNDAMLGTGTYVKYERFKDNLRLIVDICRDANAVPIIVTPPPIYDESFFGEESGEEYGIYGGANGFVTNYACLAREAAREKCVCIADMNAAFWDVNFKNYIGGDGVTLNEKGAELYARTSLDAYRTATLGDPSFDGRVGATDYLLIKRSTLGTYEMTQAQTARSDADGDGKIDAVDYLMVKRHVLDTYHIDRGEHSAEITYRESVFQGTVITAELIPGTTDAEVMEYNMRTLQACYDELDACDCGTIILPEGVFYFSTQGMNSREYEDYVCMPRNDVTVVGAGTRTILKPVGVTKGGLDMFYYNESHDSANFDYITNDDYYDFVIDGELAHTRRYTSAGKGFLLDLCRDCDWYNVIVKNTDGTGFGIDCPVNCTAYYCKAFNCGKAGSHETVGASGFGIAIGYNPLESLHIDNCVSEGNMKYGYFFEHQGRFTPNLHKATYATDLLVTNSFARDNFIDYGGELAVDVTYRDCTVIEGSTAYMKIGFRHHSIRCHIEGMNVEEKFDDVSDPEAYYYDAVYWALNKGITAGVGGNQFGLEQNCVKAQLVMFLYRMADLPGELFITNVAEQVYYEDALKWAIKAGIADSGDGIENACSYEEFAEMLWRYAGRPEVSGSGSASWNWALAEGIVDPGMTGTVLRKDAVTLLYRGFADGNG